MLRAQEAGVDAFIIRDMRICGWKDITVPLHASTQCAILDPQTARACEAAGCSRVVLERQLSLEEIRRIREAVSCEMEVFVHGALCVGYSGLCRLSEHLDGRSADRGECIQACRSLYDLEDSSGKVLARNKALLSLKDFNLLERLPELAEAGASSFKIEGRLKNISYVRNTVRAYSLALDRLVAAHPEKYRRASFGRVSGGFAPDPSKTFNRGFTELYLDGRRGKWACPDAPKAMGEKIGTVVSVRRKDRFNLVLRLKPAGRGMELRNGDGLSFVRKDGITGFRADVCNGNEIICKDVHGLREGTVLFRNVSSDFEKTLERDLCRREIPVSLEIRVSGRWSMDIKAVTADGRSLESSWKADVEKAENTERAEAMMREQLGKRALHYVFSVASIEAASGLPILGAATLNSIRRLLAEDLDAIPCTKVPMQDSRAREDFVPQIPAPAGIDKDEPLMRSRYCIKYELGLCPSRQGAKPTGPLFLVNNGRRLSLGFDCARCEMSVIPGRR